MRKAYTCVNCKAKDQYTAIAYAVKLAALPCCCALLLGEMTVSCMRGVPLLYPRLPSCLVPA